MLSPGLRVTRELITKFMSLTPFLGTKGNLIFAIKFLGKQISDSPERESPRLKVLFLIRFQAQRGKGLLREYK